MPTRRPMLASADLSGQDNLGVEPTTDTLGGEGKEEGDKDADTNSCSIRIHKNELEAVRVALEHKLEQLQLDDGLRVQFLALVKERQRTGFTGEVECCNLESNRIGGLLFATPDNDIMAQLRKLEPENALRKHRNRILSGFYSSARRKERLG